MKSSLLLSRWRGALAAVVVCAVFVAPACADEQSDRVKELELRLERSLRLIEQLAARVAELEKGAKALPPKADTDSAPARAEQAAEVARLQETVNQMSSGLGKRESETGLPLHGFADVGAAWSAGDDPVRLSGFNVGTLDLYLTSQIGDRVKALAEIAFEFERDGHGSVELERLQLGYTVSDATTVWLGRFHTPFGLWNTSFHHGANLQTSIFRPRFVEFEDTGGIVPAHSVGLWASGRTRLGGGRFTYDAYLANGPSIRERVLDPNTLTDDTANKLVGFNLGYQPNASLGGLTVGVHGFDSTVKNFGVGTGVLNSTHLRMAGAYFGFDADDWEAIGEFYAFRNRDVVSRSRHSSDAAFVHLGRAFGQLTPFVRFERTALDPADNYFRSQRAGRSYRRSVLGARYAFDARSSVKFELSSTSESAMSQLDETGSPLPFAGGAYRRAAFQYSIAF